MTEPAPTWWRSFVDGELAGFGHLIEAYQRHVFAVAVATVIDRSLAEDVVQETFLAAHAHRGELRDVAAVGRWLATIARNKGRDLMRAHRREALTDVGELEIATSEDSSPQYDIESAALRSELAEALARVPASMREALVLYYAHDHSAESVARELGLSEAATMQRLSRGRKLLRQYAAALEDYVRPRRAAGAAIIALLAMRMGKAHAARTTRPWPAAKVFVFGATALAFVVGATVVDHALAGSASGVASSATIESSPVDSVTAQSSPVAAVLAERSLALVAPITAKSSLLSSAATVVTPVPALAPHVDAAMAPRPITTRAASRALDARRTDAAATVDTDTRIDAAGTVDTDTRARMNAAGTVDTDTRVRIDAAATIDTDTRVRMDAAASVDTDTRVRIDAAAHIDADTRVGVTAEVSAIPPPAVAAVELCPCPAAKPIVARQWDPTNGFVETAALPRPGDVMFEMLGLDWIARVGLDEHFAVHVAFTPIETRVGDYRNANPAFGGGLKIGGQLSDEFSAAVVAEGAHEVRLNTLSVGEAWIGRTYASLTRGNARSNATASVGVVGYDNRSDRWVSPMLALGSQIGWDDQLAFVTEVQWFPRPLASLSSTTLLAVRFRHQDRAASLLGIHRTRIDLGTLIVDTTDDVDMAPWIQVGLGW